MSDKYSKDELVAAYDAIARALGLHPAGEWQYSQGWARFYRGKSLGLKVSVELFELFTFALVCRSDIEELPDDLPDLQGREKTLHVAAALERLGHDMSVFRKKMQALAGAEEGLMKQAALLRVLLTEHWHELEGQSGTLFRLA